MWTQKRSPTSLPPSVALVHCPQLSHCLLLHCRPLVLHGLQLYMLTAVLALVIEFCPSLLTHTETFAYFYLKALFFNP